MFESEASEHVCGYSWRDEMRSQELLSLGRLWTWVDNLRLYNLRPTMSEDVVLGTYWSRGEGSKEAPLGFRGSRFESSYPLPAL